MLDGAELVKIAREVGVSDTAIVDTSVIQFHEDFRKACEKNFCGKYDTNWMGPPAIGPVGGLIERARSYQHGLLLQTVHRLVSNFDMKGMLAAAKVHDKVFREVFEKIGNRYPGEKILPLAAGCCNSCEKCAYLDNKPCRNPGQAVSSVEAYGMNVIALEKSAGLPYYNGKNSVTYVGLILFDKRQ